MRASLTVSLLLASLLSACTTAVVQPAKQIGQSGSLKVHPGLLGQPVPPELQTPASLAVKPVESEMAQPPANAEDLRTQRSLYFSLNQTDLKADYDQILMAHARYLARTPAARMRIEGHGDERGSANYNKRLGLKRAQSIRATLIGYGADPAQIGLKSWGNSRPKVKGRDEAAWAENRRADIIYERER
jgi:peptidoglycan-associated lipoprotein